MILLNLYKRFEFWILRKIGLIKFKNVGIGTIIKYGLFGNPENIDFGNYIYIGENSNLWGLGGIKISSGTIIGPNITIRSSNHDYKTGDFLPYGPNIEIKPVFIGENCWIGDGVNITPGTKIGEGCIIGMGSVVSGDIPDFSIVVGNPGKIIKNRDMEQYNKLKSEGKIYLMYKKLGKI